MNTAHIFRKFETEAAAIRWASKHFANDNTVTVEKVCDCFCVVAR